MVKYEVLKILETSLGKLKIEEIIESNPLGEGQLRISLIRSTGKEYEIATVAHIADEDVLEVYPSDEESELMGETKEKTIISLNPSGNDVSSENEPIHKVVGRIFIEILIVFGGLFMLFYTFK